MALNNSRLQWKNTVTTLAAISAGIGERITIAFSKKERVIDQDTEAKKAQFFQTLQLLQQLAGHTDGYYHSHLRAVDFFAGISSASKALAAAGASVTSNANSANLVLISSLSQQSSEYEKSLCEEKAAFISEAVQDMIRYTMEVLALMERQDQAVNDYAFATALLSNRKKKVMENNSAGASAAESQHKLDQAASAVLSAEDQLKAVKQYMSDELNVYERDKDAFFKEFISIFAASQAVHYKALSQIFTDANAKISLS